MRLSCAGLLLFGIVLASAPAAHAEEWPTGDPVLIVPRPVHPEPERSTVQKVLHPLEAFRPLGCWARHDSDYNCGSGISELRFVFGSCRNFWGEACKKGPPPLLPDGSPAPGGCPNCR